MKKCFGNPLLSFPDITSEEQTYLEDVRINMKPWDPMSIPANLRGGSEAFEDPALASLPFPPHPGIPVTSRFEPPVAQVTTYKPRSLAEILLPESTRIIAAALRDLIKDMRNARRGRPIRQSKPVVIGQDGFWPNARGVVWDTSKLHFDDPSIPEGYYKPLDYDADVPSHLHNQKLFDRLGDDYPDQELRHMIVTGFFLKVDAALQIVILPHLLSLADGFESVDKELDRLEDNGYLRFIARNEGHLMKLDDGDLVIAIGCCPFRAGAQGSVGRAYEDRRRRLNDAGAPRKPLFDNGRIECLAVNRMINESAAPNPHENKTTTAAALQSNVVLQHASFIFKEPLHCFSDDLKDFSNQLFWHPS